MIYAGFELYHFLDEPARSILLASSAKERSIRKELLIGEYRHSNKIPYSEFKKYNFFTHKTKVAKLCNDAFKAGEQSRDSEITKLVGYYARDLVSLDESIAEIKEKNKTISELEFRNKILIKSEAEIGQGCDAWRKSHKTLDDRIDATLKFISSEIAQCLVTERYGNLTTGQQNTAFLIRARLQLLEESLKQLLEESPKGDSK